LRGRTQTVEVVAHDFDLGGELVVFYFRPMRNNEIERDVSKRFMLPPQKLLPYFQSEDLGIRKLLFLKDPLTAQERPFKPACVALSSKPFKVFIGF
jgi:hypothetical protein